MTCSQLPHRLKHTFASPQATTSPILAATAVAAAARPRRPFDRAFHHFLLYATQQGSCTIPTGKFSPPRPSFYGNAVVGLKMQHALLLWAAKQVVYMPVPAPSEACVYGIRSLFAREEKKMSSTGGEDGSGQSNEPTVGRHVFNVDCSVSDLGRVNPLPAAALCLGEHTALAAGPYIADGHFRTLNTMS